MSGETCEECRDFYSGKPTPKHDLELGCAPTCPCQHDHRPVTAAERRAADPDLDAIEQRARAAWGTSWFTDGLTVCSHRGVLGELANCFRPSDARHIAGMDPDTTLALVAAVRAERERAGQAEARLAKIVGTEWEIELAIVMDLTLNETLSAIAHEHRRAEQAEAERDSARAELARLRETVERALPVVEYVSRGRGYVGIEQYPDALARRANAEMRDALSGAGQGETKEGE